MAERVFTVVKQIKKNITGHKKLVAVILVVLLLIASLTTYRHIKVHNVFDEMYYSEPKTGSFWETGASIRNMNGLKLKARDSGIYFLEDAAMYDYRDDYLEENESLGLIIKFDEGRIIFGYVVSINDNAGFCLQAKYYLQTRILLLENIYVTDDEAKTETDSQTVMDFLTKYNITREDIEAYKQYYLYDKIITDFCGGNGLASRFSATNIGKVTIVDETYSQLGPEWQEV